MAAVGAGLVGRALADRRLRDYEDGRVCYLGGLPEGLVDGGDVVAVDLEHPPAVRLEAPLGVVAVGVGDVALDLDVVEVVDGSKPAELQRSRERGGLVAYALLHVAVAAEDPSVVGAALHLGADGEPDRHREALAERARRHLDAGHDAALRVAGAARAELPEVLQLLHRERAGAGKVHKRVDERRGVAAREDEPVAVLPAGVGRVERKVVQPQRSGHVGHPHRGAGMPGIRLLHHVRAKAAYRVSRKFRVLDVKLHGSSLYYLLKIRNFRAAKFTMNDTATSTTTAYVVATPKTSIRSFITPSATSVATADAAKNMANSLSGPWRPGTKTNALFMSQQKTFATVNPTAVSTAASMPREAYHGSAPVKSA